jgi:hypothetical protein
VEQVVLVTAVPRREAMVEPDSVIEMTRGEPAVWALVVMSKVGAAVWALVAMSKVGANRVG